MRSAKLIARLFLFFLLLLAPKSGAASLPPAPPIDLAPVRAWIERQKDITSIQADFTQSRILKTRRSPLVSTGYFAFSSPHFIRWQVGAPPQEIALRTADSLFLISAEKKRAKQLPAGKLSQKTRMQSMGMIEFPFVRTFEEFERQFNVLNVQTAPGECRLELAFKDKRASRYMQKLLLAFEPATGNLRRFELQFRDGSKLQNLFSNIRVNRSIDPSVFAYDLTGYDISVEKD